MAIVHKTKPFGGYQNSLFGRPKVDVSGNPLGKPILPSDPAAGSPAPDPFTPGPDAAFLAAIGANAQSYGSILAQLPGLLNNAAADYGYTINYTPGAAAADASTYDPNDPVGSLAKINPEAGSYSIGGIDPNNPNSRAAALQRAYQNQQRGNTTSLAARGQLYSGALQNAQNDAAAGYQSNEAANARSFANVISGLFGNATNARNQALTGGAGAVGDLANRMSNTPAPTTVTYAGVPYNPAGPGQPYASPVGVPTAASAQASKSLIGSGLDVNEYRPGGRYYKPKKAKT